jgi:sugar O-acyltransferase (sialic acid O-acetyltransferase NeuD family)
MKLIVFGAGGYSREVADVLELLGHDIVTFYDDHLSGFHSTTQAPIISSVDNIDADGSVFAIGDNGVRRKLFDLYRSRYQPCSFVHPSASVSRHAQMGDGVQILQYVSVNAAASIGENVIVNVGSIVSHDVCVGGHTHIAPSVLISGGASVGAQCFIGAGAVILPGVDVADRAVVGAGAVVTRNVLESETVVGVPARSINKRPLS